MFATPSSTSRVHTESRNSKVRLEERGRRTGFILMDFARERGGHGPGRMAPNEALQDIPLRAGQNFGEDTGIAYDPASGYAAIQYNHYGPRDRSIEEYLYAYDLSLGELRVARAGERQEDLCGFSFGALLKRDAYERLRRFGIFHEIDFTIALPGVNRADLEAGRNLTDILRAPLPEGVETLSMHIKAAPGRKGVLGRAGAIGIIDELQRLGEDVKRAFVRGKPTGEDRRFQNVDLVEERLSADASLPLNRGQRYSRDDRWAALVARLSDWLESGALQGTQR